MVTNHYFFFLGLCYTEVANTAITNALSPVQYGARHTYSLFFWGNVRAL